MEPASASQRARHARRSSPVKSTRIPASMGTQIARLIIGSSVIIFFLYLHEEGQQEERANNHGEGIVIDQASLQLANDTGQADDQSGRTVDNGSVNQLDITNLPKLVAQPA